RSEKLEGIFTPNPKLGHARPELRDPGIRVYPVTGFLVIYRVDRSPMVILRVVRGTRNPLTSRPHADFLHLRLPFFDQHGDAAAFERLIRVFDVEKLLAVDEGFDAVAVHAEGEAIGGTPRPV